MTIIIGGEEKRSSIRKTSKSRNPTTKRLDWLHLQGHHPSFITSGPAPFHKFSSSDNCIGLLSRPHCPGTSPTMAKATKSAWWASLKWFGVFGPRVPNESLATCKPWFRTGGTSKKKGCSLCKRLSWDSHTGWISCRTLLTHSWAFFKKLEKAVAVRNSCLELSANFDAAGKFFPDLVFGLFRHLHQAGGVASLFWLYDLSALKQTMP